METRGTVTAIFGEYADVEVRRRVMCDGCPRDAGDPSCGHKCAMGSLLGDRKNMTVRVKNAKGAAPGDTVILESAERTVLLSAFLFFILPLLLAAAGYALGGAFAFEERARLIGAVSGFALAYVFAAIAERRAKKDDTLIVMREVVKRAVDTENK